MLVEGGIIRQVPLTEYSERMSMNSIKLAHNACPLILFKRMVYILKHNYKRLRFASMIFLVCVQIDKPMAIVGTSLGGAVAIDFAVAHPEAVSKLILFAPQVR